MYTGDRSWSDVVSEMTQYNTISQCSSQIIRQLHLQTGLQNLKNRRASSHAYTDKILRSIVDVRLLENVIMLGMIIVLMSAIGLLCVLL